MTREIDALVAEKVMGWYGCFNWGCYTSRKYIDQKHPPEEEFKANEDWSPTTDLTADYEVLKHVREDWNDAYRGWFCDELRVVWSTRANEDGWKNSYQQFYEPGDYSKAALKVLLEKSEDI